MSFSPIILTAVAVLLVLVVAVSTMGIFNSKNRMPVEGKTVLMTGASEGLGLSSARILSSKGANIVIVSRSVAKMEIALADIKAAAKNPSAQRFHYISADISKPDYAEPVFAEATAWNNSQPPDVVWCVAGSSTPSLFTEAPVRLVRDHVETNYFGAAEMCHAALRQWLAPDAPCTPEARHLIMTTSPAALFPVPGYATYGPAKAALRTLADSLSLEVGLYPQNVRVHLCITTSMYTPGFERENRTKPEITHILERNDLFVQPDEAARDTVAQLEAGRYATVSGLQPKFMWWSGIGGSLRDNWLVDTIMAMIVPLVATFGLVDILMRIQQFAKSHEHPRFYHKKIEV